MVICAGGYDLLVELVCTDDDHLLDLLNDTDPDDPRRHRDRDLRLPEARQTDLRVGDPMNRSDRPARPPRTTSGCTSPGCPRTPKAAGTDDRARRRARTSATQRQAVPGRARRAVRRAGRPRPQELADAAAKQAAELAYFPIWSYAHPTAVELADRLADLAPGDLNRVFFTTGGSEAVESAWKLARSYFKRVGKPMKHKVISRARRLPRHRRWARCRSPASRPSSRTSSRWCREHSGCRTPTTTGRPDEPDDTSRGVRPLGGRPDRRGDRVRGAGHGRRGVPGAGAERRRLLPAAARILPAGPGDLRPVRRAARLRRGDLRVRPARRVLRRRPGTATSPTSSPAPRA